MLSGANVIRTFDNSECDISALYLRLLIMLVRT